MTASELSNEDLLLDAAAAITRLCCLEFRVACNNPFMMQRKRASNDWVLWEPLTNGHDALSLVSLLGMEVYVDNHPEGCKCVEVESHTHKSGRIILSFGSNIEADTRRAIVMCAANLRTKR